MTDLGRGRVWSRPDHISCTPAAPVMGSRSFRGGSAHVARNLTGAFGAAGWDVTVLPGSLTRPGVIRTRSMGNGASAIGFHVPRRQRDPRAGARPGRQRPSRPTSTLKYTLGRPTYLHKLTAASSISAESSTSVNWILSFFPAASCWVALSGTSATPRPQATWRADW
jgi:hypothetical protein